MTNQQTNLEAKFRCNCPITSALDVVGDKWILVIIKQMLIEGKESFKNFIECDEAIATNILSAKLKQLEEFGLVVKSKLPNNQKSVYYHLTEKGLSLAPVITELALWSDENLRELNPIMVKAKDMQLSRSNKEEVTKILIQNYKAKLAMHHSSLKQ